MEIRYDSVTVMGSSPQYVTGNQISGKAQLSEDPKSGELLVYIGVFATGQWCSTIHADSLMSICMKRKAVRIQTAFFLL